MSQEELQKSEKLAALIMRTLAITGLVAVLAIMAWFVVQGVRHVPQAGEGVTAMISAITSVFRSAPEEMVVFDLESRSLEAYKEATIRWTYVGADTDAGAEFRYSCNRTVELRVQSGSEWHEVACNQWFNVNTNSSVVIVPRSLEARYADIELTVRKGGAEDTTLVTIVNNSISGSDELLGQTVSTTTTQTEIVEEVTVITPAVPTPVVSAPVAPTPVTPVPVIVRTPADLAVDIKETGSIP